jgi:hypothetical protein
MNVAIKNFDLGWLTETPVTVTKKEDNEITWCNHANAFEDTIELAGNPFSTIADTYTERVLICDKCDAWKEVGGEYWQEVPEEGAF